MVGIKFFRNVCMPGTRGVMAKQSEAIDLSSVVYRMWVRILAWSVATLVPLSKALYHNCFSPLRSVIGCL